MMSDLARTTQGEKPHFIDIARPFSNFGLIEESFEGILPLRRIMSQVRQHDGQTMVIEELKEAPDLAQENEDIKIRCPSFKISKTHRLSFFTKRFSTRRGLSNATEEEFIGYAIVKQDAIPDYGRVTRIYESVIKPSRYVNNFIKGDKEWTCSIVGNLFKVKGYIYAQQNAITNVCAHVALRTAASCFHKDEDMLYREMNELIGIDHVKRKLEPGKGLDTMEMVEILSKAGASCIVADYTNPKRHKNRAPFQKLVYGSIESGFPAIVIFETAENTDVCHAIPIFGHTFNDDTWVYKAELSYFKVGSGMHYIPSESWTSTYIAHDDNYGSNFCIPRMYLHVRRYCNAQNNEVKGCSMDYGNVCYVIGTLPREVRMNAIQAEVIGADYLFTILPQLPNLSDVWPTRLCYYAGVNQLVLRPILIRSDDYSRHLSNIRGWKRKKFEFEIEIEPEGWLWLIELSVPELFSSNKRKIAEVVLRSDVEPKSQRDFNSFLLARVPGYFALYSGGQASNPNYNFIPSGIVDHVELYGCEESM